MFLNVTIIEEFQKSLLERILVSLFFGFTITDVIIMKEKRKEQVDNETMNCTFSNNK